MPITAMQTDTSHLGGTGFCDRIGAGWICSAGAAAGGSHSIAVLSGGAARPDLGFYLTMGQPGMASLSGVCVVMVNITTANTNVTWGGINFCVHCGADTLFSATAFTSTSTLGLSFGTTGVKTASVEATGAFDVASFCPTASAYPGVVLQLSNAAAMNATFNYLKDQNILFPSDAGSSTPATADVFNLATTRAGK